MIVIECQQGVGAIYARGKNMNSTVRMNVKTLAVGVIATALIFTSLSSAQAVTLDPTNPPITVDQINPNDPVVAPRSIYTRGSFSCGNTAYAPPGYAYGALSQGRCGIFGYPGAVIGYTWKVADGSDTQVCASGLAFTTSGSPSYVGLGCGSNGAKNVYWGNVLAYQKLKAMSITLTGGYVPWY